jgi:hypothetical protein
MSLLTPPLYWTAPRLPSGDFSPEDPLALDYIGQQVGNWIWPGFTSRTGRAGYYMMVCYGLKKVDELLGRHGLARTDDNRRVWFERFERIWALAICAHYGGHIPKHEAMRGKNGVTRMWRTHRGDTYPIAYTLISRQLELAGLGAYLTSLRAHGLVAKETLKPTPIGAQLAARMWSDDGHLDGELESFVDHLLEPGLERAPTRHGRQTLASLGRRCRLGRITERPELRSKLDEHLFGERRRRPKALAVLPEMARGHAAAWAEGVRDMEGLFTGLRDHRWGRSSKALVHNARAGIALARTATVLRVAFDRIYRNLVEPYELTVGRAVSAVSGDDLQDAWAGARAAWDASPTISARLVDLPVHGPAFVRAVRRAGAGTPAKLVEATLGLHDEVERNRGRSESWIARSPDRLVLQRTGWRSWHDDPHRWVLSYKHGTMSSLLMDLGRLQAGGSA